MKTPKEITIDYLESIEKEKLNILDTCDFSKVRSVELGLTIDIQKICRVIEIVKESEGE